MAPRPKVDSEAADDNETASNNGQGAAAEGKTPKSVAMAITKNLKHKRRYCRIDGCTRIVKSQGLCQRHGAKPKTCKVEGCDKQAQGNFDRMCKSHFKAMKRATTPLPPPPKDISEPPPPARGTSVYDYILPASIRFVPTYETTEDSSGKSGEKKVQPKEAMPLIAHLKEGFDALKPPAWHRNEERRCRGFYPIHNPATQLEGWERELVWMEILVLTGAPGASFRHLARAWGRDKGFHMVLAQFICERHGDVERKKRQGIEAPDDSKKRKRKVPPVGKRGPNVRNLRRRRGKGNASGGAGEVAADVWDGACYGDDDYNEALAADIFNFSDKDYSSAARRIRAHTANGGGQDDEDDESEQQSAKRPRRRSQQKQAGRQLPPSQEVAAAPGGQTTNHAMVATTPGQTTPYSEQGQHQQQPIEGHAATHEQSDEKLNSVVYQSHDRHPAPGLHQLLQAVPQAARAEYSEIASQPQDSSNTPTQQTPMEQPQATDADNDAINFLPHDSAHTQNGHEQQPQSTPPPHYLPQHQQVKPQHNQAPEHHQQQPQHTRPMHHQQPVDSHELPSQAPQHSHAVHQQQIQHPPPPPQQQQLRQLPMDTHQPPSHAPEHSHTVHQQQLQHPPPAQQQPQHPRIDPHQTSQVSQNGQHYLPPPAPPLQQHVQQAVPHNDSAHYPPPQQQHVHHYPPQQQQVQLPPQHVPPPVLNTQYPPQPQHQAHPHHLHQPPHAAAAAPPTYPTQQLQLQQQHVEVPAQAVAHSQQQIQAPPAPAPAMTINVVHYPPHQPAQQTNHDGSHEIPQLPPMQAETTQHHVQVQVAPGPMQAVQQPVEYSQQPQYDPAQQQQSHVVLQSQQPVHSVPMADQYGQQPPQYQAQMTVQAPGVGVEPIGDQHQQSHLPPGQAEI